MNHPAARIAPTPTPTVMIGGREFRLRFGHFALQTIEDRHGGLDQFAEELGKTEKITTEVTDPETGLTRDVVEVVTRGKVLTCMFTALLAGLKHAGVTEARFDEFISEMTFDEINAATTIAMNALIERFGLVEEDTSGEALGAEQAPVLLPVPESVVAPSGPETNGPMQSSLL